MTTDDRSAFDRVQGVTSFDPEAALDAAIDAAGADPAQQQPDKATAQSASFDINDVAIVRDFITGLNRKYHVSDKLAALDRIEIACRPSQPETADLVDKARAWDAVSAANARPASADIESLRPALRSLVDWTHLYDHEGRSWPDHETISDPLIALAMLRGPTQADADAMQNGTSLRQLLAEITRPVKPAAAIATPPAE